MLIAHKNNVKQDIFDRDVLMISGAELAIYHPWFLCEVPEFDEVNEVILSTTYLLDDIDTLAELALKKPMKAYLVSPGYMNKSANWALELLKKVSKANYSFSDGSSCIYRYETATGQAFDHDISGLNESKEGLDFQAILLFD